MVLRERNIVFSWVLLLFFPFCFSPVYAQEGCLLNKKEVKAIKKYIGHDLIAREMAIPEEWISSLEYYKSRDCLYRIHDTLEARGYLLSTSAKGRFENFDYSIIYSEDLTIQGVVVTVYRSTYGAGICQKKWLGQFVGYRGGEIELGSDIDAVSGGTISSLSIVNDIQRCHLLMQEIIARSHQATPGSSLIN